LFIAESIDPAPNPKGMAKTISKMNEWERANPKRARQDKSVLIATTIPVPNLVMTFPAKAHDKKVQVKIGMVTKVPEPAETPRSGKIAGHAAPNSESGSPNPIYKTKIIKRRKVAIITAP
jgi:hypothetical protein